VRAVIQRVESASVEVEHEVVGSCGTGYLVLLGVGHADSEATADKLWKKILNLRIFSDENGKTNRSLSDVDGGVLIVSQFTLFADCRHGNRPSFTDAAGAELANSLYEYMCGLAVRDLGSERVGHGIFAADMRVSLVNDGPFTVVLDTDEL
jgi:D-tyrosyl-tRNA(Tyr) deacylase